MKIKKHYYYDWYEFQRVISEEWLKEHPNKQSENYIEEIIDKTDVSNGKIIKLYLLDNVVPEDDPEFKNIEQEYGSEKYKFMRWLISKGFNSNTALRYWW